MTTLLKRRITIFGRSVPLALVVALMLAGTAAAAFLLVHNVRLTGTALTAPQANWDPGQVFCNVTGNGTCNPSASGTSLTGDLAGVDDDTQIELGSELIVNAANDEAICITAVSGTDPNIPVSIGVGGTAGTTGRAPASFADLSFDFDLSGITPGYDFGATGAGVDVEWQYLSTVQVGGLCP